MDELKTPAHRTPGRSVGLLPISPEVTHNPAERWLPVVGYEGLYEVSDLGRVRSLYRGRGAGGVLKPQLKRYLCVNLYRDRKMRTVTVHSLVARAFLGPRPDGHEVCHGPAGKLENGVANLSYGTPAKNLGPDKYRDGTIQAGVRNGKAKLNDQVVRQIRIRLAAGEIQEEIARDLGVSRTAIRGVRLGTTWRHVA